MSTVDKETADKIVAGGGRYAYDPIVYSIWEYENAFDGRKAYKLIYRPGFVQPATEYIRNPKLYFKYKE